MITRTVGLLVAVLGLAQAAGAGVSAPNDRFPRPESLTIRQASSPSPTVAPDGPLTLTPKTEVLVNGKPCAYRDVPQGASILRVEVAEDRTTILRIEFRVRK